MTGGYLVDTDILVDYLRGRGEAAAFLDNNQGRIMVSTITVAELYVGVREGRERQVLEQFLRAFVEVPVDKGIARKGGLYRRDYGPRQGVGLADAIIAATAESEQAQLVTLNERHFPRLKVHVPYRRRSAS